MEITQKMIDTAMSGAVKDLRDSLVKEIKNEYTSDLIYNIKNQISEFAIEWTKKHLLPEIEATLLKSKGELIKKAGNFSSLIADELMLQMAKTLKDKMKNSWDREKLYKELFT